MTERLDLSGDSRYPVGDVYTHHLLGRISTGQDVESVIAQVKINEALGIISKSAKDVLLSLCEPQIVEDNRKKFVSVNI